MIDGFAYTDLLDHQNKILAVLRLLRPFGVEGGRKVRVGRDNDGGYVMIDNFAGITAAYSLGINDDVSWDRQIADRGIDIFQYDHTIDALPEKNARFHWSKTGICGVGAETDLMKTLPSLMDSNHHKTEMNLILKMDIEGFEWPVFSTMPSQRLKQFRQIVCEFHGLQHVDVEPFYANMLSACERLAETHRVVHVHANNNTAYAIVGGVPIPACLEISFIRMDDGCRMIPSAETFPTDLDMPCFPGRVDYKLGNFVF